MAEIVKELELGEKEIYLGELKAKDRYQVLIRHLNVIEGYLNAIANNGAIQSICAMELCRKQGIEIDKIINNKED